MLGMKRLILLMVLPAAGCGAYAPALQAGAQTDVSAPAYQADLQACQTQSAVAVDKRNAKTGLAWLASPVRRPFQVRAEIRSCLKGKGYPVQG